MPEEYRGFVTLDDDDTPLHNVLIDDLDRADWHAAWQHPSEGGFVPPNGGPVRVVLRSGTRAGQRANARFAGQIDWWLEGFSPFT